MRFTAATILTAVFLASSGALAFFDDESYEVRDINDVDLFERDFDYELETREPRRRRGGGRRQSKGRFNAVASALGDAAGQIGGAAVQGAMAQRDFLDEFDLVERDFDDFELEAREPRRRRGGRRRGSSGRFNSAVEALGNAAGQIGGAAVEGAMAQRDFFDELDLVERDFDLDLEARFRGGRGGRGGGRRGGRRGGFRGRRGRRGGRGGFRGGLGAAATHAAGGAGGGEALAERSFTDYDDLFERDFDDFDLEAREPRRRRGGRRASKGRFNAVADALGDAAGQIGGAAVEGAMAQRDFQDELEARRFGKIFRGIRNRFRGGGSAAVDAAAQATSANQAREFDEFELEAREPRRGGFGRRGGRRRRGRGRGRGRRARFGGGGGGGGGGAGAAGAEAAAEPAARSLDEIEVEARELAVESPIEVNT